MFIKVLCCFLFFINCVFANNKIEYYIKKANDIKLYQNNEWLALIHYKKTLNNNYKSIITSKNFFLSKEGINNPKKELENTIKAFFNQSNINEITTKENRIEQHALCRFPARFEFINKHLKINSNDLPKVKCTKYEEFFKEIQPESLTIIFPTAYINNPASMFGHTLIRIDKKNPNNQDTNLNSIAINYGADTNGEISGLIFAFKGIFGLYDGFYSAMPYYKITNNYNNLESRNIWEYKTNYTKQETQYYTKHIWELIQTRSPYYFFQKNCSYYLLDSLNILRPDTKLLNNFNFRTIPIETIKVLYNNNIITDINYRSGLQQEIKNMSKQLNKQEKKSVKNILNGKAPIIKNGKIYETAYKLLQYNKTKSKISPQDYRKQSLFILKKINNYTNTFNYKNTPTPPQEGHKFNKLNISYGYSQNDKQFIDFVYKPAYHELLDFSDGFEFGSQINFFTANLRYYFDKNKFDLEKFDFMNIKSLALYDYFFKPTSFSVLFGINNLYNNYKILLLKTNGGFTIGNENISFFGLIGPSINYSGHFKHNANLGINSNIGTLINFKYFKTTLDFKLNKFIDNIYNYNTLNINTNINITKNFAVDVKYNKYFYKNYKNNYEFFGGIKIFF